MFPDIAMSTRSFRIDGMMHYSLFVSRFYNLFLSLGFEPGSIMPSHAFCADKSQGFPIIPIAKHFGAFPFGHGSAGGIVATNRHGPHAHHSRDLIIIQAHYQNGEGGSRTYEQAEITDLPNRQETGNTVQTDLEARINEMIEAPEISIEPPVKFP